MARVARCLARRVTCKPRTEARTSCGFTLSAVLIMEHDSNISKAHKAPLITPSASPPPSQSFFPQPYRIPDQPSPTKRQRLLSTSRQHKSLSRSSSSSADPFDFHQAREDSTLRLLSIWSNLDRYTRPLDEDDIIDITTGEVVKDRGVIRGSKKYAVGCFAMADEEDDEEDEEDDELDSFANVEAEHVNLEVDGRKVPPVRAMDPMDAKDLEEFLEAERKRKELCGSEPDESDYESQNEDNYGEDSLRIKLPHCNIFVQTRARVNSKIVRHHTPTEPTLI